IDKDRLDREAEAHAAELARLAGDVERIDADAAREAHITDDAGEALARLADDLTALQALIAGAPERGPELEAAARAAEAARALAGLVAQAKRGGFAPALDSVSPDRGYEAALAAALGDDLDAALDPAAPSYWGGREAHAPKWPEGATPLAPLVKAPAALAAR